MQRSGPSRVHQKTLSCASPRGVAEALQQARAKSQIPLGSPVSHFCLHSSLDGLFVLHLRETSCDMGGASSSVCVAVRLPASATLGYLEMLKGASTSQCGAERYTPQRLKEDAETCFSSVRKRLEPRNRRTLVLWSSHQVRHLKGGVRPLGFRVLGFFVKIVFFFIFDFSFLILFKFRLVVNNDMIMHVVHTCTFAFSPQS